MTLNSKDKENLMMRYGTRFCFFCVVLLLCLNSMGQEQQKLNVVPGNFDYAIKEEIPPIDDSRSLEAWKTDAANGDANAQAELGLRLFCGQGIPQKFSEAKEWLTKSAKADNAKAMYLLGVLLRQVEKNYTEGNTWIAQSAEKGYAFAQSRMGTICYGKHECLKAIEWHKKAAEQGVVLSMYEYGMFLFEGKYVKQDMKTGTFWLLKAAEKGFRQAQFEMGVCYVSGEGVPKNPKVGFDWLLKAAVNGHPRSQFYVGILYYEGQIVDRDRTAGLEWIRRAAKQNQPDALKLLERIN